jgi:ribonuclease HI
MKIVIQFDGGVTGLDGAGAAVAYTPDGILLAERARFVCGGTSNVYEYTGLIIGLQLALDLGAVDVEAWGDSELIVRQVNRVYECRKLHLQPFHSQAIDLLTKFAGVTRVEVFPKSGRTQKRRNLNGVADALAGECKRSGQHIDRDHRRQ